MAGFDFHIHTKYLGCANGTMEIPAIVHECEQLGVTALAITDHLNALDKLDLHRPIRRDIEALDTDTAVYFGVELNFTGKDQGFAYSAEVRDELGFQFAIGGIHSTYLAAYDVKEMVAIQHRHHLKACADPLVDVLVHPYWFGRKQFEKNEWPWFDSMRAVPASYARELGQVAKETGTAIEINACANLENPAYSEEYVKEYVAYLAVIAEEGPRFAVGSDAHDIGRLRTIQTAWQVVKQLELTPERIWQPNCAPMVGRRGQPQTSK
ncbi:MAG: PHP domain-containing protein [Kiritimatiellae bacterium]|nr:PHP domain-containing protein [Kiritimatiellia bacterium]